MRTVRVVIQVCENPDERNRGSWRILSGSTFIREDATPEQVADAIEIIGNRINSAIGRI